MCACARVYVAGSKSSTNGCSVDEPQLLSCANHNNVLHRPILRIRIGTGLTAQADGAV
jgi:hypothetical protein